MTDRATDEEIAKVRAALDGITPLPWTADEEGLYIFARGSMETGFATMVADDGEREHPNLTVRMRGFGGGEPQERNLHAIATVMNAAPSLLSRIEQQEERIREMERENEHLRSTRLAELSYVANEAFDFGDTKQWARNRVGADLARERERKATERSKG